MTVRDVMEGDDQDRAVRADAGRGGSAPRGDGPTSGFRSEPGAPESERPAGAHRPPIEFGWVVVGDQSKRQREALDRARDRVRGLLTRTLPEFEWRLPRIERRGSLISREEPAMRLREGALERERHGWDFALVLTPNELRGYRQDAVLAVPSRALRVAVASLDRLVGAASTPAPTGGAPAPELAGRIAEIALHLFARLNGLRRRSEVDAITRPPTSVVELDRPRSFDERERRRLRSRLEAIAADTDRARRGIAPDPLRHRARALVERVGDRLRSGLAARPWKMPFRLRRMGATAGGAMALLVATPDVWELGARTSATGAVGLSVLALLVTSGLLLLQQDLLWRPVRRGPGPHAPGSGGVAAGVLFVGLLTCHAILFGLAWGIGEVLFRTGLLAVGPDLAETTVHLGRVVRTAGLVASVGVLIGALGAAFEPDALVWHVVYADEEI